MYAQYGKDQKEHLPALHIKQEETKSQKRKRRPGQVTSLLPWLGSCLLTACRKHVQQKLLSLKATRRLSVENLGCIHSAKQQKICLVSDCYVILPNAQTCLHCVSWSHVAGCMLLHATSSQPTLPQSAWRALALTENAKKIMITLTCFWHCQKWFKQEITEFFIFFWNPIRFGRENQEYIHVLITQPSNFVDSLP